MAATVTEADREQARRLLADDFTVYAPKALKIVTKGGQVVPFVLKKPQLRLVLALQAQRAAGKPMRADILKSRQVGFSTLAQGLAIQRATSRPHHRALTLSHKGSSSADLFDIGKGMWQRLPAGIKPPTAYSRDGVREKYLQFGEAAASLRKKGIVGLDSRLTIAASTDPDAGRSKTIHTLHLSEVAFWAYKATMNSVLQAVPDEPDTLVLRESTAQGHNFFKDLWDEAVAGTSGYIPCFSPWFEEPTYRRPFENDDERWEFERELGTGRWGDDEHELHDLIAEKLREWAIEWDEPLTDDEVETRTLEHLYWRRWAIVAKSGSSLDQFHQEYPSTPDEAFLSTGRKVFDSAQMRGLLRRVEKTDPVVPTLEAPGPALGLVRVTEEKAVRSRRDATILVPQQVMWVPRSKAERDEASPWKLWELPQKEIVVPDPRTGEPLRRPAGQYIVAVDPMSGDENEGTLAQHSIQVIDHRTLRQVAEYVSMVDADLVALEALKIAMLFNDGWIAVERTGGYGRPINNKLAKDWRWARLYEEQTKEQRVERRQDRLGWNTDPQSKPEMLERAKELLREEVDGIVSRELASEMLTYVRDERGKTFPEKGKRSDRLMAWMIAQMVARRRPLRPDRASGSSTSTGRRRRIPAR